MNTSKNFASAFIFIAFALLALGSLDTDSGTKQTQTMTPSYTLSADQLYSDYSANEVAADSKYKDKVVIVSGTIQDIGKDIMDEAYIVIGGGGVLDGVQCMFTEGENSSVAQLTKGQRVTVKGEVSGKMGNVLLRRCALQ